MIPLRDINPTRTRPILTYALIAANVMVFLHQVSLEPTELERFVHRFGVVPAGLTERGAAADWLSVLTSMFLHGSWLHLISNMWFLYIFGDNVEDVLGRIRFVIFYVTAGLAAVAGQVLIDPGSPIPMVGASGAISGVLGAYLLLFPHARVVALIPVFFIFLLRELPAVLFIFVWFAIQLLSGLGTLTQEARTGGVAFFAHIGGFLWGLGWIRLLGPRRYHSRGFRPTASRWDRRYDRWP